MAFYVEKNRQPAESMMDPAELMAKAPDYYGPRFDAIAQMREADDGTGHKGAGFRRVASFVNVPLFMANKITNPDFLRDKKQFYAFIDRYPEYVSYQRLNKGRGTATDDLKLPLSALGLEYPGAPETIEGWDAVDVPLEPVGENSMGPATDPEPDA